MPPKKVCTPEQNPNDDNCCRPDGARVNNNGQCCSRRTATRLCTDKDGENCRPHIVCAPNPNK